MTSPEPLEGAVQSTVQERELEFEWVTSSFCILAFEPGFENAPWDASRLKPPLVPEGPPEPPIVSVYTAPPEYPEAGRPESSGVTVPVLE